MPRKIDQKAVAKAYVDDYINGNKTIKQIAKEFGVAPPTVVSYGQRVIDAAQELHRHMNGKNVVKEDLNRAEKNLIETPPLTTEQFFSLRMCREWRYPDKGAFEVWMENKNNFGSGDLVLE